MRSEELISMSIKGIAVLNNTCVPKKTEPIALFLLK